MKLYECQMCAYKCVAERDLKSHLELHSDVKPYWCDQCDKCFRKEEILQRHQDLYHNPGYVPPPEEKRHEKRHECPECGKPFSRIGNLIRHLSLHDPDAAQQELQAFQKAREQRIQGSFVKLNQPFNFRTCEIEVNYFLSYYLTEGQSLEGLTEGEETDLEDEDRSLSLKSNEELVCI